MALRARPIGSTLKPFIYGLAIEKGARPYTLLDDREYRFDIDTGFAFYPKNYDGIYRGPVTLNYALSNSLNVPAVRALQFDGVDAFGKWMQETLGFVSRQPMETYELGVALGGLEMHPLLLANFFTVFPRGGMLYPLSLGGDTPLTIPMLRSNEMPRRVFTSTTSAIVTRMLADRLLGVEQFGLEGNLNLPFKEYAVKTGTTYDYHDSWAVGYTPDVVAVVWVGNSDNKPMNRLSGARGAGKIWNDVMNLLAARGDIVPHAFEHAPFMDVVTPEGLSFGLPGDDIESARLLMASKSEETILEPHDGDVLKFERGMSVPLRSRIPYAWSLGGNPLGSGSEVFWEPARPGNYRLEARRSDGSGTTTTMVIRVVE
jgi:membrane carboxypeptidase/penicillin-binding protein PbpC